MYRIVFSNRICTDCTRFRYLCGLLPSQRLRSINRRSEEFERRGKTKSATQSAETGGEPQSGRRGALLCAERTAETAPAQDRSGRNKQHVLKMIKSPTEQ